MESSSQLGLGEGPTLVSTHDSFVARELAMVMGQVFLQNLYVETLTPNVIIFENKDFGL